VESFENPIGYGNRIRIVRAIKDLGGHNVSWSQIKAQLAKNAIADIDSDYSSQIRTLDPRHKERRIKKELCMSEQALAQNLKKLMEKGVLEKNKDGLYSFTDKVLADARYFAPIFGSSALWRLLNFPLSTTITQQGPTSAEDLPKFIERFGMLLIFIFIEGSRKIKDDTMKPEEKDKLAREWVQNAVPIQQIFYVFLSVYGPKDRGYYDGMESSYEIPDQTLDMLHNGLKRQNPEVYKALLDVFADYMGEPKERSLSKNRNKPGYFIYPRD